MENDFLMMVKPEKTDARESVFTMIPLAVLLLLLSLFGNSQAFPQQDTRFFVCPNYRDFESLNRDGRNDPLWLLEKEDEWIPFRAYVGQEQPLSSKEESNQPKTFRCIFFYLAAFSNFMLDLFTPAVPVYYVHPYYRVDGHVSVEKSPASSTSAMFNPPRNR